MKILFCFFLAIGNALAFDAGPYLKNADAKIYSLKAKGVKDFVVDAESSKLTEQINEQKVFGNVEQVIFRFYWTANPERLDIEVLGMPEGFKEAKEELKKNAMGLLEYLLPSTLSQKFQGYKLSQGTGPREIIAKDSTGVAIIPAFVLKFSEQDVLVQVTGQKPVGRYLMKPVFKKESFSDGKWILKEETLATEENGMTLTVRKEFDYTRTNGVGVLSEIKSSTTQKFPDPKLKAVSFTDKIVFKNYKINEGVALKHFLNLNSKK